MAQLPQQELITDILRFVMALPSEVKWVARRIEVKPVTAGVEMAFTESDGERQYVGSAMLPDDQEQLVRDLQQAMYDPQRGAWISAEFDVTAEGSGDARFNYTEPPQELLTGPGLDPADAADHLRRFPAGDGAPAWLADAAASA